MKIHALWCHPRSVSTAFERIMRERGDLNVLHEPFMYHHYLTSTDRLFPAFTPDPGHPATYADIRAMIRANHEHLLRTKQVDLAITSNPFLDMDGLERHLILKEDYLLVLPKSYQGPIDSLEAIQRELPLVRFGDSTNAGRQIAQHLRRLRFEPDKVIQADRSSMVTSCVSAGQAFSLLTPTLLIDGVVENMKLRLLELPVFGLSRTLTVVARKGELRELPTAVALLSKLTLIRHIAEHVGDVAASSVDQV